MTSIPRASTTCLTLQIYWHHLRRYKHSLAVLLITSPIIIVIQGGLLPKLYGNAIDQLHRGTLPAHEMQQLFATFVGLHLIIFAGQRFMSWASSNLEFRVIRDIEQRIFNWLLAQSYSFHTQKHGGALVAQAKRFTGAYSGLYNAAIFNILTLLFRFLVAISFLAFIAPAIALVLTMWAGIYIAVIVSLTRKKAHMSAAASSADSLVTAQLSDVIGNASVVQMFGREDNEAHRYAEMSGEKYQRRKRDWRYSEAIIATQSLLMIILEATVLYYSIMLIQNGTFTVGQLALVQFFLAPILVALWDIGRVVRQVESSLSDAAEMTTILTRELDIKDAAIPEKVQVTKGSIEFKEVGFSYQGKKESKILFEDFNLTIKPGEKVGLVGPSGSGKSTLSKLLLRFMETNNGQVLIDGQDITRLRQAELRRHMAFVPQEPLLFHRSIKENIRYAKPEASDDEVIAAAKEALAHDFIMALPEGYDTSVGERGGKLSGGERQRIAIARALLKDAPIIVLDEATSALDSASEKMIQCALDRLMHGKTAIVIAHRLSTIRQMDRIVVLRKGTVEEDGTHNALLQQGGLYAQLWRHQSGTSAAE